jgi:diguanylate cyclase (GGDEF)-like protein
MKKNITIFLFFTFLWVLFFSLITVDKNERISELLKDESKYLEISYKQGLDRFHVIAENVYTSLENDEKFINIFADVDKNGLKQTHDAMLKHLQDEFIRLQQLGVMGLQIVLPNNVSLLRMHKTDEFEDDLTAVRYSLDYVNKNKTHLHGFEEGRTSHAFRELYPMFKEGKYLGVMEVLFSSTRLQDYTMRASEIHTHFLVDKNVFEVNAWESNLVEPYQQSIEHVDYLFSLNNHMQDQRLDVSKKTIITPLRAEIDAGIASKEAFEVYKNINNNVKVVSFIPIERIKDAKVVAYLVSYTSSDRIHEILNRYNYLIVILSFLVLFAYLLSIWLIKDKNRMLDELKYDPLTKILNRKYFTVDLNEALKNFKRDDDVFTVVMADIDFFKNVNDTYGHQYGDTVLVEFAKILKDSVRSGDKVARYGGEEFILLLLTDKRHSFVVIENIRQKIKEFRFGEKNIELTASFGIAQMKNDETIHSVIKRADDALYLAKENGRNQTQVL